MLRARWRTRPTIGDDEQADRDPARGLAEHVLGPAEAAIDRAAQDDDATRS